jgi:hypothetical protein
VEAEVGVPELVPVAVFVAVTLALVVVESVPESEPVFEELAPFVTLEVGVREIDELKDAVDDGEMEAVPVIVDVPDIVAVSLEVCDAVSLAVPESEPVCEELAPAVTDAVGDRETDRDRLIVELVVDNDEGVPVGVELAVGLVLADNVPVDDGVSESDPVCEELAPVVTDAVGDCETDRDRLSVVLGVDEGVAVLELVGDPVGVPLPEMLDVALEVSERLGVTLALAPKVTEDVAVLESDALREGDDDGVIDGVPDPDEVPETVLVCDGVSGGVTLADSDTSEVGDDVIIDAGGMLADSPVEGVVDGVADAELERLRVVEPLSLPDGVGVIVPESDPVFEELSSVVTDTVGDTSAGRLGGAGGVSEVDPLAVADTDGVPLPLTPSEIVDVVEDEELGVMDGVEV